jgi:hypothetical protein
MQRRRGVCYRLEETSEISQRNYQYKILLILVLSTLPFNFQFLHCV